MLEAYQKHVAERAALGLPPLPLSAAQTTALVALLQKPAVGTEATLVDLLSNQVPPGVDEASKVKAEFLAGVAQGRIVSPLIDRKAAVKLLGTMLGGYNVQPLIDLLDDAALAPDAVAALSSTLLVYDSFNEVAAKAKSNDHARQVVANWAEATWFTSRAPMPEELTVTVFKVAGETNTDDLSPASEAWSRPDIPLHAQSM
ncbi:MAG: bifunctional aconitate hydratase 2/2-methylisocitrate dehydratase, partial [Desulfobulbia bacterium]